MMEVEQLINSQRKLVKLAQQEYEKGNFVVAEKYCTLVRDSGKDERKFLSLMSAIYLHLNEVSNAEMYARKAIQLKSPPSPNTLHILGMALKAQGKKQEAMEQFEKAVGIDPHFVDGHESIATMWLEKGDVDKAINIYENALKQNPQLHHIRNHLGTLLKEIGRKDEAKSCFSRIVNEEPNFVSAWNNLGCLHHTDGEHPLAINCFEKAVAINANYTEAWINLGNILKECNLVEKAKVAYERAHHLLPGSAYLAAILGSIHHEQGNSQLAILYYKKSVELEPNYPNAHCNLANILKDQGWDSEAEKYYRLALFYDPGHPSSLNNLANMMRKQKNLDEAIRLYIKALEKNPEFVIAHTNIASVYKLQGNLEKALAHYQEAVRLNPNSCEAYAHMGNVLKEMFHSDAAFTCYETSIHLNPKYAEAYCFKANIIKERGKIKEAIELYKYALQLDPECQEAFCNMMYSQLQICDWTNYKDNINRILKITIDQINEQQYPSLHPHHTMLYPITFYYHKLIAEKYANFCQDKVRAIIQTTSYSFEKTLKGRLKIGYVSSDFGNHPTSHLMQSLPGLHNRDLYEIFCYALNPHDGSSFRAKIAKESEHFVDVSHIKCYSTVANMIYKDGIHILVNMNGYTKGAMNEVFALHPAPIQAMWLGYPGTSGSNFIDYLITDSVTSPLQHAQSYSECLAHMPHSFFIGDHKHMFPHLMDRFIVRDQSSPAEDYVRDNIAIINTLNTPSIYKESKVTEIIETLEDLQLNFKIKKKILNISLDSLQSMVEKGQLEITTQGLTVENGVKCGILHPEAATGEKVTKSIIFTSRRQYGLPDDAIVYCNFNQMYKIEPIIFKLWISILQQVPNSVLWLLRFPQEGEINILKKAKELGLEENRIIFSDVAGKEEHVRRGQLADLCLDTTVCNGHTTTMDILWTGTPVVTWPIETMASRIAASQLSAMNCKELIATNPMHYVQIAVKLGTDQKYLNLIRAKVLQGRDNSPLFDCYKFNKNLEYLYVNMWQRYSKGLKPDHVSLNHIEIS